MEDSEDNHIAQNRQSHPSVKQFGFKLCVAITLVVVLLGAGKAVSYFRLPALRESPNEYKSYVLWQVTRADTKTGTIMADGLRLTENSQCAAGEPTIWMFGGSGLRGEFLHDSQTIPSNIAKNYADSGRPVCVKNYGQVGWVSTQEVIKLMLELKRAQRKPDVVIFCDGTTDSYLPYESDEIDAHLAFPFFKAQFESWKAGDHRAFGYLRKTNTYMGLQALAKRYQLVRTAYAPRSIPANEAAAMAKRTLENYTQNMQILESLSAHYGFRYICFFGNPGFCPGRSR
jgi:hypothetical protein